MNKVATINLKGNDYATVPERLKRFREEHPNADIQSKPQWNPDGSLDFMTRIIVDQKDEYSAKGTGWAHYSENELKQPKAYEKLQTISKGRALADIGYLNNGDIASTEELEEFYGFQFDKYEQQIDQAKDVKELLSIFSSMNSAAKKQFTERLGEKKKELTNAANAKV